MSSLLMALIVVLVLIFLGLDIFTSFLAASAAYLLIAGGDTLAFTQTSFSTNNQYALLAVPLFMVGGTIMERSGIAASLVNWCEVLLRRIKHGMGAVIPVSSMIFGAMCGSSMATVSTIGNLLIDKLEAKGWDRRYTTALASASAPLGYMIPPNINACVFSLATSAAVSDLFMASIIPGILWCAGYCVVNAIVYKKWWNEPTLEEQQRFIAQMEEKEIVTYGVRLSKRKANAITRYFTEFREGMGPGTATLKAIPAILMPVIIIGGIYSGIFTPTEAGSVSAIYAVLTGILVYRRLNVRTTWSCFSDTARSLATLMIIFPAVMILTRFALLNGLPEIIKELIASLECSRAIKLILIDIIFLIAGCFVDAAVLVLVLPTLLSSTMQMLGVGDIQFGCIVFMAVGIGSMTPPMASSLFVGCRVGRVKMQDVIKPLMPFMVFVAIPVMLLVTFVPGLSTWLPSLLRR